MSGWQRASQAHIVFWFGISLVFGMTRRIVRDIIPGRSWVNNQVSCTWQKTGDSASLEECRTIVRDTGRRPGGNNLGLRLHYLLGFPLPRRMQNNCSGYAQEQVLGIFINFFIFSVDI
tara:strand:- start:1708 stop:2061 length:354 start_codon:yes stop_codon:yes gene_type:complete